MKKVKVDEKSKFLSAVFVVVVLCGLVFFFGYKKFEEKATRLDAENAALETRIRSLETYYLTEEQNKKDTQEMTQMIGEIFSTYPGDARFEDGIYEAYNLYGGSMNTFKFESVGFSTSEPVKVISGETVAAAQIEEYPNQITFNRFDVTYRGTVTYDGLKGMVRDIATSDYKLAIGQMSYQINESGYIDGSTLLSFYSVDGAGCPYTEPPVTDYETGLQNLFGVSGSVVSMDEETAEE